jgi:hypothetical protein
MKLIPLFIIATLSGILGIASGFSMLLSDDLAMQSLGGWYILIGLVMLGLGLLTGITLEEDLAERKRSRRGFRG